MSKYVLVILPCTLLLDLCRYAIWLCGHPTLSCSILTKPMNKSIQMNYIQDTVNIILLHAEINKVHVKT